MAILRWKNEARLPESNVGLVIGKLHSIPHKDIEDVLPHITNIFIKRCCNYILGKETFFFVDIMSKIIPIRTPYIKPKTTMWTKHMLRLLDSIHLLDLSSPHKKHSIFRRTTYSQIVDQICSEHIDNVEYVLRSFHVEYELNSNKVIRRKIGVILAYALWKLHQSSSFSDCVSKSLPSATSSNDTSSSGISSA